MVRILGEADVARAISIAEGVRIVEAAIRQYTEGQATLLPRLSLDLPGNGGAFRVMAASMPAIGAFGLKTLTGYPGSGSRVKPTSPSCCSAQRTEPCGP